ncbi:hypothetical protein BJ742DRAFT_850037 [Cladochytrium replicatum]|nr:hypothetical protein BJ742DRAFT_850037 [Cladochytrium replicatum]
MKSSKRTRSDIKRQNTPKAAVLNRSKADRQAYRHVTSTTPLFREKTLQIFAVLTVLLAIGLENFGILSDVSHHVSKASIPNYFGTDPSNFAPRIARSFSRERLSRRESTSQVKCCLKKWDCSSDTNAGLHDLIIWDGINGDLRSEVIVSSSVASVQGSSHVSLNTKLGSITQSTIAVPYDETKFANLVTLSTALGELPKTSEVEFDEKKDILTVTLGSSGYFGTAVTTVLRLLGYSNANYEIVELDTKLLSKLGPNTRTVVNYLKEDTTLVFNIVKSSGVQVNVSSNLGVAEPLISSNRIVINFSPAHDAKLNIESNRLVEGLLLAPSSIVKFSDNVAVVGQVVARGIQVGDSLNIFMNHGAQCSPVCGTC